MDLPADPTWADLFAVAADVTTDEDAVREARSRARQRRGATDQDEAAMPGNGESTAGRTVTDAEPSPARVVADADVLAADLLLDGGARDALDVVREHDWVVLVASDALLAEAEAVVRDLAGTRGDGPADEGRDDLASAWRRKVDELREPVDHPAGDHPALASAMHGGAMHVLTLDDRLTSAKGAATVRSYVETSVRRPDAFALLFDPESLYEDVVGGAYPGPDRDPRA